MPFSLSTKYIYVPHKYTLYDVVVHMGKYENSMKILFKKKMTHCLVRTFLGKYIFSALKSKDKTLKKLPHCHI